MEGMNADIVIAGAGLGGLAAGLGLADLGLSVLIVERRRDWERRGSAFGLAPNARKALREISPNVVDKLEHEGILMEKAMGGGLFLGWWMVRNALLEEVRANGNIRIRLGCSLLSFDDITDPTCIEICVSDEDDKLATLRAKLLVAADGCYSTVRKLLHLPPARATGKTQWRGSVSVPEGSPLEPFLEGGVEPLFPGMNLGGNTIVVLFNFHPKIPRSMPYTLLTDRPGIAEGTHAREVFDPVFREDEQQAVLQELWDLSDPGELTTPLPVSVVEIPEAADDGGPTDGWGGRGRVTIIGDAAHALRPVSGLGGAMAFEDAVLLCRCMREKKVAAAASSEEAGDFLEGRESAQDLVLSFENSRVDRVRRIWKNEWEIAESAYKKEYVGMTPEFQQWVHEGV